MKTFTALAVFTVLALVPFTAKAYGYYDYRANAPVIRYQSGFYNAPYNMITYRHYTPEVRYPYQLYSARANYTNSYVPYNGSYASGAGYGGNWFGGFGGYGQGGVMVIQ